MILLFKLFQPAGAIRFEVTVRVPHSSREESRLFSDDGVRQGKPLLLVISRPVRESSFYVGKFAFRPFYRRSASIVLVEILFFLTQHLRDSTTK